MNKDNPHMNNPLQGVGLKTVLEELVSHYGFDILYAYLNMNCFKTNPSIAACAKFLKKTDWAREKVEIFYLYQYKNLPKVSSEQFNVEPRERIVPEHIKPGKPAILSIEDGERLQQKRSRNAESHADHSSGRSGSSKRFNEHRSEPWHITKESSQGDKSIYYEDDDIESTESRVSELDDDIEETKPDPEFNPWGNYKKKT